MGFTYKNSRGPAPTFGSVPNHFLLNRLRRVARVPSLFWMVRSIPIVGGGIPNGVHIQEFARPTLPMQFVRFPEKVLARIKPLTQRKPEKQFNLKPVNIFHGDLIRGLVPPRSRCSKVVAHCFVI